MAKKTVAAKKRNVKVEAIGQAHIHSSFNNHLLTTSLFPSPTVMVRLFPGLPQVKWDSGVQKRIHLMQPKWRHKIVQKSHST